MLVLIITLVAILLKESRPVPVAAIPVGKAAPTAVAESSTPAPKAEFEVFTKARLVPSKNNEGDTLRIKLDDQHDETVFTLYFVDAPEITLTHPQLVQDQARYFQISQDAVLKAGAEAAMIEAEELGISHRTVEVHKARVLEKLGVRSVVELVRLVDRKDRH